MPADPLVLAFFGSAKSDARTSWQSKFAERQSKYAEPQGLFKKWNFFAKTFAVGQREGAPDRYVGRFQFLTDIAVMRDLWRTVS